MNVWFYLFDSGFFGDDGIYRVEVPGFFSGFGEIFRNAPLFAFFFTAIFLIIFGTFLYAIIRGITTFTRNSAAERLTEYARVLTKRTNVSGGSGDRRAYTTYYITFEFVDGHRLEFKVRAEEYGLLVEGDEGMLTHQGTRYLGFERGKQSLGI